MHTILVGLLAVFLAPALPAMPGAAAAHAPGQGYMFLRLHDDSTIVRLEVHVGHLERALSLGWDPELRPTPAQVEGALARIRSYLEPRFAVAAGPGRPAAQYRGFGFRAAESGEYLLLEYLIPAALPDDATITFSPFFEIDDTHRNLVVVEHNWRTGTFDNESAVSLILSPREPTQVLDLRGSTLWKGFLALVRLGVWHIWIGIDHILFLIALILPSVLRRSSGKWIPADRFATAFIKILKIVTSFTVAHTITLSLAALGTIDLPSRLVESVIAASIAAAALHNLWPLARVNEVMIAFVFGLFHGFGFASVLGGLGLGSEHLVLSLLGFNFGVEVGQVAIVAAIFPVLFLVRRLRFYNPMLRTASVGLIAIGLLWVAERALGFNVPLVPIARAVLGLGGGAEG
jgi:hypothetical protein